MTKSNDLLSSLRADLILAEENYRNMKRAADAIRNDPNVTDAEYNEVMEAYYAAGLDCESIEMEIEDELFQIGEI